MGEYQIVETVLVNGGRRQHGTIGGQQGHATDVLAGSHQLALRSQGQVAGNTWALDPPLQAAVGAPEADQTVVGTGAPG